MLKNLGIVYQSTIAQNEAECMVTIWYEIYHDMVIWHNNNYYGMVII